MVNCPDGTSLESLKGYTYRDNVFTFEGCISVQREQEWAAPWRIDYSHFDFYPFLNDEVGRACSGVRLCFTTDSRHIVLDLADVVQWTKLDLFADGKLIQEVMLNKDESPVAFQVLDPGLKRIEIWLDTCFQVKVKKVLIDEGARICKTPVTQKRWVHYGSSISHSGHARTPSKSWAALVAQKLDLHLTNLGYGANCKLEPMVGRMIRDLPADYITLKLGINVYHGNLSTRTFAPNVIGLIQIIREKHPDTPLAVISPIYSPPREEVKGGSGMSLKDMRCILADIVESCKKYGDRNIYYGDGLKVFGLSEAGYLHDELHPVAAGEYPLSDNIIKEVFSRFPGIKLPQ